MLCGSIPHEWSLWLYMNWAGRRWNICKNGPMMQWKAFTGHHQNTIIWASCDSHIVQKRGDQKDWVAGALPFLPALNKSQKCVPCLELLPYWGKTSILWKLDQGISLNTLCKNKKIQIWRLIHNYLHPLSVPNPLFSLCTQAHIHSSEEDNSRSANAEIHIVLD